MIGKKKEFVFFSVGMLFGEWKVMCRLFLNVFAEKDKVEKLEIYFENRPKILEKPESIFEEFFSFQKRRFLLKG